MSQTFYITLLTAAVMSIGWFIQNQILSLSFQILVGIGTYLLLACATKQEAVSDGISILKEIIPIRRWKNVKY